MAPVSLPPGTDRGSRGATFLSFEKLGNAVFFSMLLYNFFKTPCLIATGITAFYTKPK